MLRSPVPQDAKKLEISANDMATKLISRMKRTGNAKPGVLFQIIYREEGIRKICFLKLAWFDESYFDYDEGKSSLTKRDLMEKLPLSDRFQKGAIYPHPNIKSKAYMKVYQQDAEANYFESFLGGLPEISGRAIMKEFKRLAKSVTGKPLSLEQNIGLFQGIRAHLKKKRKQVEETDVTRIIQDTLPSESKKAIKEIVNAGIKVTGIVDGAEIEDLKMVFRVSGISLSGSYSDVTDQFEFEGAGQNKHTIQGLVRNIKLGSRQR